MRRAVGLVVLLLAAGCVTTSTEVPRTAATPTSNEPGTPRNRAQVHTELASLYYSRGSMGVALEELRVATTADPTYAPAHGLFGMVYMTCVKTSSPTRASSARSGSRRPIRTSTTTTAGSCARPGAIAIRSNTSSRR